MRILRIALLVLASLGLVAYGAFAWLTAREDVPATTDYRLDLAELRQLAASLPGERPLRVNAEKVAMASIPRAGVFAGESFDPHPMSHVVYQLVGSDGFVLIDTGFSAEAVPDAEFDAEAMARVVDAMGRADHVVITHEHSDHIGGLAVIDDPKSLAGRLHLTREQLDSTDWLDMAAVPEEIRGFAALDYDRLHAIAPGVVLVKAAGHTPGSQMIYASLEDGREMLFLGDVAWHGEQIRELHYRPRLTTDVFLGEDRSAVLGQFRALYDLSQASPEVTQVVSHDVGQLTELHDSGAMGRTLE